MKWFQVKEQSAGKKRLILSWYLYKIFGSNILYLIAFFVALFTFIFAKKVRGYSKKYLSVIKDICGIEPSLINQFRHIHSYAVSLVDKMLVYSGDFDIKYVEFENKNAEKQHFDEIAKKKGMILLCNHVGNVEVLQTFFRNSAIPSNFSVNIFISRKQSKIFNSFIEKIKTDIPVNLFLTEDIDLNTGIELEEIINEGGVIFIAGDRLSETNADHCIETELFSHKILLPKGAFTLSKVLNVPIYFISAIKTDKTYKVYVEPHTYVDEKNIVNDYIKFMEQMIKLAPLQFYHFYDFFN